jgi:hypothetical protein
MVFLLAGIVLAAAGVFVAGTLWVLPLEWWGANKDAVQAFVLPFDAVGRIDRLGVRRLAQLGAVPADAD